MGDGDLEESQQAARSDIALLPFQRMVVQSMLEEDALCVLGRGLGLHSIVAAFARLHQVERMGLVIIVGSYPWQIDLICQEIKRHDPCVALPPSVNNTVPSSARSDLYKAGGCLFLTTRILVVDLLANRVKPNMITGMIIMNAHRVTDTSGEGFAARLFRAGNKDGFLRAFSDDPVQFKHGFMKIDKVLKALYLKEVQFWPRFHESVKESLRTVEVTELECELSDSMKAIQLSVIKVLEQLIHDLQRINKIDCSELDLQNAFYKSFDTVIKSQLNPIWNTVGPRTPQIVRDIRTVQELAFHLLRYDAVSLLRYLEILRLSAGARSEWLFHSATHTIFQEAKNRVYELVHPPLEDAAEAQDAAGDTGSSISMGKRRRAGAEAHATRRTAAGAKLQPVLEEMPKWWLLREVLTEVHGERAELSKLLERERVGTGSPRKPRTEPIGRPDMQPGPGPPDVPACGSRCEAGGKLDREAGGVISLLSDDEEDRPAADAAASCGGQGSSGVEPEVVTEGGPAAAVDVEMLEGVLAAPVLVVVKERFMVLELQEVLQAGGGPVYMQRLFDQYLQDKVAGGQEARSAAARRRPKAAERATSRGRGGRGECGRGRGGRSAPESQPLGDGAPGTSPLEQQRLLEAAKQRLQDGGAGDRGRGRAKGAAARWQARVMGELLEAASTAAASAELHAQCDAAQGPRSAGRAVQDGDLHLGVHFLSLEAHELAPLWQLRPAWVVLYDPDLAMVRSLEVYRAAQPGRPLKVYLLEYRDSVEQARFKHSIEREQDAFVELIRYKGHMVLPASNPALQPLLPGSDGNGHLLLELAGHPGAGNHLTRRAGGLAHRKQPREVVVDMREFMSSLPAVLHQHNFLIHPVTLEVGDFVLSPEMCLERKSLPDLYQSLDSGRLYQQADAMSRHYGTPILLIEFQGDRAFALQGQADIGDYINARSITSKLCLLALHFPKLRWVWSRSLQTTAQYFAMLKSNQDEPDAAAAAQVGLDPAAAMQAAGGEVGGVVNPVAVELLLQLPGVTRANYRGLLRRCETLAHVAKLSMQELQAGLGSDASGKLLHSFLHETVSMSQ